MNSKEEYKKHDYKNDETYGTGNPKRIGGEDVRTTTILAIQLDVWSVHLCFHYITENKNWQTLKYLDNPI